MMLMGIDFFNLDSCGMKLLLIASVIHDLLSLSIRTETCSSLPKKDGKDWTLEFWGSGSQLFLKIRMFSPFPTLHWAPFFSDIWHPNFWEYSSKQRNRYLPSPQIYYYWERTLLWRTCGKERFYPREAATLVLLALYHWIFVIPWNPYHQGLLEE